MSEEEIELLIKNLCLDEKPHIEKDELYFLNKLLKLYEEDEKNVYNVKILIKKGKFWGYAIKKGG